MGNASPTLWFAQNTLPLRWQRQRKLPKTTMLLCCDLLKIYYLCGDKDNNRKTLLLWRVLWFAQNSLPLRWQRQRKRHLKSDWGVVICSKFITFAVTKTTKDESFPLTEVLWFAQNSLPLRWQRQHTSANNWSCTSCDLLKIHYLCGDKDNHCL